MLDGETSACSRWLTLQTVAARTSRDWSQEMAMRDNGERQGLTESFRSQTGYGTAPLTSATKKTTPKTRKFIAKKVFRTDTLVGIALKYAVSVSWDLFHLHI